MKLSILAASFGVAFLGPGVAPASEQAESGIRAAGAEKSYKVETVIPTVDTDPLFYAALDKPEAAWSYYAALGKPEKDWKTGAGTAGWKQGALPIGYNMTSLSTIFTTFNEPSKKFPVTYFRKVFELPVGRHPAEFLLEFGCDDGCIAYLNGVEIGRLRMPKNAAAQYGAETHDRTRLRITIPAQDLKAGPNMLAVEVHQRDVTSSDMRFDALLTAR